MAEGRLGASARRLIGAAVAVAALGVTAGSSPPRIPWSDRSGYALQCLAVGAAASDPGLADGPGLELFRQAADDLGPLTVRRSFDARLPSSFDDSAAAADADAGVHSFVSWKPPGGDHRGAAAGDYDDEVRAWARSVPRTGVFATAFHEPENDMTGPEFVALQRHLYRVVKEANPTIRWGPVYMAYWWDPAEPGHWIGAPEDWWPGSDHADFVALDWYGRDPAPMTESGSFTTWYRFAEPFGLPLFITEYGQYLRPTGTPSEPAAEQARADAIRRDAAWMARHPRITMWIYWQGGDRVGDWRMQDEASRQAWREVAESGCPASSAPDDAAAEGRPAD